MLAEVIRDFPFLLLALPHCALFSPFSLIPCGYRVGGTEDEEVQNDVKGRWGRHGQQWPLTFHQKNCATAPL
jgi:hypothetical protein